MYYLTVTALLTLGSLFATGSTKCYSTGHTGNHGVDLDAVEGIAGACLSLEGKYGYYESRTTCLTDGAGVAWTFGVEHISSGSRKLGFKECVNGISKQAHDCERGGRTSYGNWEYRADPNSGSCNE